METRTRKRKHYRLLVKRTPPYSRVNSSYYYEHDIYAYSESGAFRTFSKYHEHGYGSHTIIRVREISREQFRGQHKTADPEMMSASRAIEVAKLANDWGPQVRRSVLIEYRNRDGRTEETRFVLHTDVMEEELKAIWQNRCRELNADPDSILRLVAW